MKYKINISIDDISPHPRSSTEVLNRCHELIDIFPNIKFSLFIPMAYWRTARPGTTTEKPLIVSAYTEFCEILKNLPKETYYIYKTGGLNPFKKELGKIFPFLK